MPTPVTEQFLSAERTQELLDGKAPLDHVHEGGGGSIGGIHSFGVSAFTYMSNAGEGTQMDVQTWFEAGSLSHLPNGDYGIPDPPLIYLDGSDNRLYAVADGWYQLRMTWFIYFPTSTPTVVGAYANISGLDPKIVQYYPVAPARNQTYSYNGNFPDDLPHSTGELLSTPFFCAADDWLVDSPSLWWDTTETDVKGGIYPGPIPTLTLQFTKVG